MRRGADRRFPIAVGAPSGTALRRRIALSSVANYVSFITCDFIVSASAAIYPRHGSTHLTDVLINTFSDYRTGFVHVEAVSIFCEENN